MSAFGKAAKWIGLLLAVSLALNFLIAGMMLSRHLGGSDKGRGMHPPDPSLRAVVSELPDEARKNIRNAMRENRANFRQTFKEMRQTREEVGNLLRAETVDKAALDASFEKLRELGADLQEPLHGVLTETLMGLPLAERQKIADRAGDWRNYRKSDRYKRGKDKRRETDGGRQESRNTGEGYERGDYRRRAREHMQERDAQIEELQRRVTKLESLLNTSETPAEDANE